jgi:hypothetical protein
MTANQVATRLVLMCVSGLGICTSGLLGHASASAYLWSIGGLLLGYGISFALALWKGTPA